MITLPLVVQYLGLIAIIIGVIAYVFKTYKDSTTHYDQDTITRLKESNDILRQENQDLKTQLAAMDTRIKSLEQANEVLKGIVTGKDTLADLQKTIAQFLPYVGAFEDFKLADETIIRKIDYLTSLHEVEKTIKKHSTIK